MGAGPRRSPDRVIIIAFLIPSGIVAGLLYASGVTTAAVAIVVGAFAISTLLVPEIGFYGYFALQSLDPMFLTERASIWTPGKVLAPFLLIVYLLHYSRKKQRLLVSKPFIAAMLLFGVYGLIFAPFAIESSSAIRYAAQIIVQVLLIIAAVQLFRDRATMGRAFAWAVVGGVIAAAVIYSGGGASRQFRRATLGEFANPNTTANALAVAIICAPPAWAYCKSMGLRIFFLAGIPFILGAMMTTGSRGPLIAVIISFIAGAIFARRAKIGWRFMVPTVGVVLCVSTVLIVLSMDVLHPISQDRLAKLFEPGGGIESESRWHIWRTVLETYLHHPLGFGFGNTQFVMAQDHGQQRDAHSVYLSALVDGGPITLALFGYGIWSLIRCVRGIGQTNPGIPAAIVLTFVLLLGITHTVHFTKWFWIPVMICILLAEQTARERMTSSDPSRARA